MVLRRNCQQRSVFQKLRINQRRRLVHKTTDIPDPPIFKIKPDIHFLPFGGKHVISRAAFNDKTGKSANVALL